VVALVVPLGSPAVQGASAADEGVLVSNGKIAFMSTRDGNPEIYTVNPDGTGLTRLTHSDTGETAPAWSPDGARIAFSCGIGPEMGSGYRIVGPSDICLMDADGRHPVRLTDDVVPDGQPTWSPDGTLIAFRRAGDIYTIRPDGTGLTRLTTQAAASQPAWSPDGTKIAFTSGRDRGNPEIYVMRADGTKAVDLTRDLSAEDSAPAWSPDGTRIAYGSYPSAGGAAAVWLMQADGSGKIRLAPSPGNDAEPAWSPDGTKLVFTRYGDRLTDIFIRNVDGSAATAVTSLPGFEQDPDWQRVSVGPSWQAGIAAAGLSGRATLTVRATGRATTTFSLANLPTGVSVAGRIVAGAGCVASAATITTLPGYTTTSGGTWRRRWVFNGAAAVRLRSAIRSGTSLWFDVSAGGRQVCTRFGPAG